MTEDSFILTKQANSVRMNRQHSASTQNWWNALSAGATESGRCVRFFGASIAGNRSTMMGRTLGIGTRRTTTGSRPHPAWRKTSEWV